MGLASCNCFFLSCPVQGLSAEDATSSSAPRSPAVSKKKLTFRIYFPLPPFDGVTFNALKAGNSAYNFTVSQQTSKLAYRAMYTRQVHMQPSSVYALLWPCMACKSAQSCVPAHLTRHSVLFCKDLCCQCRHGLDACATCACVSQGLLLGVGGKQLQKIKQASNARVC